THLRHTYTPLMYKIPSLNAHLGIYGCGTKRGGNHLIFKNIRAKRSKKHQSTLAWPCRAGRTGGGDPPGVLRKNSYDHLSGPKGFWLLCLFYWTSRSGNSGAVRFLFAAVAPTCV